MKKRISIVALLLSMTVLLNSCGVMFGGSKYNGTIIAKDHPNAEIYVNGKKLGNGTATSLFPRNQALTVELREPGCETKTQTFAKAFRTGNFILSVLSWGLIGLAVDLGTGASYKPDHKNPAVKKVSTKDFTFTVDAPVCK
ncbi:hypothetical protein L1S35_13080 [Flavobacterium sp. AS60]|uniref:hypothetical protein n=1 Tax=Flavobacterium anseongense TaxID=2910677 RepID=UPI001F3B9956|nr:hypothetical protein [Flavobacterium sp. AS60]MCF6130611.1 hypothetical protein [Flavobacterium sp. AS60]